MSTDFRIITEDLDKATKALCDTKPPEPFTDYAKARFFIDMAAHSLLLSSGIHSREAVERALREAQHYIWQATDLLIKPESHVTFDEKTPDHEVGDEDDSESDHNYE